jgi:hypothetical protein
VSTTAIGKAEEQHGIAIRSGFVEEAAPPGPYDAISLWHVLEHLPSPRETLQFCGGLLGDRGHLILAMPNDGDSAWALTTIGNVIRRAIGRPPTRRYERLRPGVESHIQHFDPRSIKRLLSMCGFAVDRIAVDDASPQRGRLGVMAFMARRFLTRVTPWNFGREMLVIASRGRRIVSNHSIPPTLLPIQTTGTSDHRHRTGADPISDGIGFWSRRTSARCSPR